LNVNSVNLREFVLGIPHRVIFLLQKQRESKTVRKGSRLKLDLKLQRHMHLRNTDRQVQECLGRSFAELRLSLKMRAERKRRGPTERQSGDHSQITLLSLSQHP
uniref:Vacuolar protein sorting 13 homolog B n=1 Tax=Ascaris lumbricoides TaxID=6252 RepID=A0A0M3IMM7_ASCLU